MFGWLKKPFSRERRNEPSHEALEEFMKRADEVTVDLSNVEITSNSWTTQEIQDKTKYSVLNAYFHDEVKMKTTNHEIHDLIFRYEYKGTKRKYRTQLGMNKTLLLWRLDEAKSTKLYIDPNNPKNVYLDLSFLE
jgi:polynucleotide 5'-kinase involved in rRNA processing